MATDSQSEEFWAALDRSSGGRVTLALDAVETVFLKTFPHWQGSIDRRERLFALIDELAKSARLRLPQNTRSGWERVPSPALPRWIKLVRESVKPGPPFDHRRFPWVSELAFVPELRRLRDATDALRIHEFLKNGGTNRPIVPVKERSYEIFGDEKRLDALTSSQLFFPGRLTLDVLRCRPVPATLSCVPSPREAPQPWLIVENEATFHSFCRLNAKLSIHSGIVLGSGHAVLRATEFLASLLAPARATKFLYFGDLDVEGVQIAFQLHARLEASSGISVIPAKEYYTWMISEHCPADSAASVEFASLKWFPTELRSQVATVLALRPRVPQEMIGWEWICRKFGVDPNLSF